MKYYNIFNLKKILSNMAPGFFINFLLIITLTAVLAICVVFLVFYVKNYFELRNSNEFKVKFFIILSSVSVIIVLCLICLMFTFFVIYNKFIILQKIKLFILILLFIMIGFAIALSSLFDKWDHSDQTKETSYKNLKILLFSLIVVLFFASILFLFNIFLFSSSLKLTRQSNNLDFPISYGSRVLDAVAEAESYLAERRRHDDFSTGGRT